MGSDPLRASPKGTPGAGPPAGLPPAPPRLWARPRGAPAPVRILAPPSPGGGLLPGLAARLPLRCSLGVALVLELSRSGQALPGTGVCAARPRGGKKRPLLKARWALGARASGARPVSRPPPPPPQAPGFPAAPPSPARTYLQEPGEVGKINLGAGHRGRGPPGAAGVHSVEGSGGSRPPSLRGQCCGPAFPVTKPFRRGARTRVPSDAHFLSRSWELPYPIMATPAPEPSGVHWAGWGRMSSCVGESLCCTQTFTSAHSGSRLNSGKASSAKATWTRCALDPTRGGSFGRAGTAVCGQPEQEGAQGEGSGQGPGWRGPGRSPALRAAWGLCVGLLAALGVCLWR